MKWFKHDSDATTDAKLKKLIIRHGAVGYAVYFHCLELIASDISETNITFELEHDSEVIADNLHIGGTSEKSGIAIVEEIMMTITDLGLFECDNNRITCMKLAKRLDQSMTGNKAMRQVIASVKNDQEGYVYIISSNYGCKIGKSKDYDSRLRKFDVEFPFNFNVLRVYKVRDRHETESFLHNLYQDKKLNGEWFEISIDDINKIDEIILKNSDQIMTKLDRVMIEENRIDKIRKDKIRKEEDYINNIYNNNINNNNIFNNTNNNFVNNKDDLNNKYFILEKKEKIQKEKKENSQFSAEKKGDFNEIIQNFLSLCPSLPKIYKLSETRKTHLKARIDEYGLEKLYKAFALAEESDFLSGRSDKWQANFDWIIKKSNMIKILEGNYANKQKKSRSTERTNYTLPEGL